METLRIISPLLPIVLISVPPCYIYSTVKEAIERPHPRFHPLLTPTVTFQVHGLKTQKSANAADCVSPFARRVTHQTIPRFSTTGPGNNGELSMEASALRVQSPMHTSPPFKKKQPSISLYISEGRVLIAAIFFPLSVNKKRSMTAISCG